MWTVRWPRSGTDLPAKGHVYAKTGTSILPGEEEDTFVVKAQNFAGYIETKSGRTVAYALMVNDAGPVDPADIETDLVAGHQRRGDDLQPHLRVALTLRNGSRDVRQLHDVVREAPRSR